MNTAIDRQGLLAALEEAAPWVSLHALADMAEEEGLEDEAWAWRWLATERKEPSRQSQNGFKDWYAWQGYTWSDADCHVLPRRVIIIIIHDGQLIDDNSSEWYNSRRDAYFFACKAIALWKKEGCPND